VKWYRIKVDVQFLLINSLKYLTFSSVHAVFGRSLSYHCWHTDVLYFSTLIDPVYSLMSLSKASNPFPEILQQLFGIQNQVSTMYRSELYLRTIFYP